MTVSTDLRRAMRRYHAASQAVNAARDEAYAAIRAASASGMTLRAIADVTGLSHQRVAQVLATDGKAR